MKKVNAINPEIVVHGTLEKPYYEVQYYDVDDKAWHIGYSSYELSIVCGYIRDYFNIVLQDADFQLVKHGQWEWEPGYVGTQARCSVCKRSPIGFYSLSKLQIGRLPEYPFCPKCGARMDGDVNE